MNKDGAVRTAVWQARREGKRRYIVQVGKRFNVTKRPPRKNPLIAVVWPDGGVDYQSHRLQGDDLRGYEAADCGVISVQQACGVSYDDAHAALRRYGRKDKTGTWTHQLIKAIEHLGFEATRLQKHWMTKYRTMCVLNRNLPPSGRFIVKTSDHFAAIVDGKCDDWSAGRNMRIKGIYRIDEK